MLYQFKQYFSWENLLEWAVYLLALVYVADEFDLPLVNRYVNRKWNGISGMFQATVHTYPDVFLICNFFFPDTASVHTHPANSAANPDIFEPVSMNTLRVDGEIFGSGKKKLRI